MDAAHDIFQKPFKVDLQYEEIDTPKNYRNYLEGADLPAKMKAWRVHADKLAADNAGLVSDGNGFPDSPDCERVSGGVNSKGPGAVALGRQGNWFLWGFCASPLEMTESARRAFLNTIVYMKRFDGQKPLVTRTTQSRRFAFNVARRLDLMTSEESKAYVRQLFDAKILAPGNEESAKVVQILKENEAYLYWIDDDVPDSAPTSTRKGPKFMRISIDEEAKALGFANTDPALLDAAIKLLEKGEKTDVAARLLERYTAERHGADAKAWRAWFDAARPRLFFTDAGGFRFHEKPK